MDDSVLSIEQQVRALSRLTTRDEAGRHFTERYDDETLEELERLDLIEVDRPVHMPPDIDMDRQYWTVEVTEAGRALVDSYPEYHETD